MEIIIFVIIGVVALGMLCMLGYWCCGKKGIQNNKSTRRSTWTSGTRMKRGPDRWNSTWHGDEFDDHGSHSCATGGGGCGD